MYALFRHGRKYSWKKDAEVLEWFFCENRVWIQAALGRSLEDVGALGRHPTTSSIQGLTTSLITPTYISAFTWIWWSEGAINILMNKSSWHLFFQLIEWHYILSLFQFLFRATLDPLEGRSNSWKVCLPLVKYPRNEFEILNIGRNVRILLLCWPLKTTFVIGMIHHGHRCDNRINWIIITPISESVKI